jgi:hypothetical protein
MKRMSSVSANALQVLERELRGVFGTRLQSIVVYGTRGPDRPGDARTHGGGGHAVEPPTRTMALVESLTESDLRACAARVGAWHDSGFATPLFVPAPELPRSLDTFPLEFSAIAADHVAAYGADPFAGLTIDPGDVRRACEVQARAHLLHLREGYIEAAGNGHALAVLIVESAPALAALLTSVARLQGRTGGDAAASARHVERLSSVEGGTMADVVKLASVREISAPDAERIFPAYLDAVTRLVSYIDQWR